MLSTLTLSFLIAKFTLLGVGICLYHERIKLYFFKRRWFLRWMGKRERDYCKYDIFLIYHYTDTEFVNENIVPTIENEYKVCELHKDPDLESLGAIIVSGAIQQSRRTVFFLSQTFAEEMMRMRVIRDMCVGVCHGGLPPRLVVVDVRDSSVLGAELKQYLYEDTKIIRWKDGQFWDKFRYALPHKPLILEDVGEKQDGRYSTNSIQINGYFVKISGR